MRLGHAVTIPRALFTPHEGPDFGLNIGWVISEIKVTVAVLDCFKMKPECMPAELQSRRVYVRPGELPLYANPDNWELVGRTFHPTRLQAADVERQGYCERKMSIGIDAAKLAKAWYDRSRKTDA